MNGKYTPQVQEAVTRLGSRLTYGEASEEIGLMWGIDISAGSVRQITLRNGQVANEIIEAEAARLEAEAPTPTAKPNQLVMSVDGAMVQLTSGEWREVKMVAFGEFESQWDTKKKQVNTTTTQISYFARVEPAEQFAQSALYEWQRRGGEHAQRVVAVNDGAVWIQSFIDYHCPQAIRVIDFAHAKAYLAQIGKAIYGVETVKFKQWFARMSKQLGKEPPQRTLDELRFLRSQHEEHPQIEEIEHAIRYLEKRVEMIDYLHFRKMQVPIGSGIVESGHKVVMQRRMKQAGMRWAEENLNPMLALRMGICNHTWTSDWQKIQARVREKKQAARLCKTKPLNNRKTYDVVTQVDCQRLTKLAKTIESKTKPKRGWKDHKWIFPYRYSFIHRN